MPNEITLLTAAWIAPMDRPIIRDGAIAISGERILAVGPLKEIQHQYPQGIRHDLGDVVVLPGLVNAHTHLELSDLRQGDQPNSFVDWIMDLMGQTARAGGDVLAMAAAAARVGAAESIGFGVTSIGDISKQCVATRPVLRDGPLRVVSYGEVQAMAKRRSLLDERFAAAADVSQESPFLRVGLTPHAPYTVEPEGYARCLNFAREHGRPIATHLAETPHETIFLENQTGPFRHLWEAGVNAWDEHVPKYVGGPIRFARDIDLLSYPTLLAHVNYCNDEELAILAAGQGHVVYCPRTHAYFGHPPHRWREMLAAGINVAVGTDSRASSPDLNLVDDLRLMHRITPEVAAEAIWEMGTIRGARAIMADASVGSISAGKLADFAIFQGSHRNEPLRELLETNGMPIDVWISGVSVKSHGLPGHAQ